MADFRVVVAALVVCMTLLITGVSYAADQIVLICSGTATYYWNGISTDRHGPDGLVIDLDGGIVTWGDVAIPIVKTPGTFIEFESKEIAKAPDSHSYIGTMDRITGGVSITEHWIREIWDSTSYPNQPEMKFPRDEEISYDLTCKRTNPVF